MTNHLKRPTFISTFSDEPAVRDGTIDLSGDIPQFDEERIIVQEKEVEVDGDFLYVALNIITWYQALEGRMTDAEIAMFQPVLERILSMLKTMNGTV